MWKPKDDTDTEVKCPHCGIAFDVQRGDFDKVHKCNSCHTDFKIPSAYICTECGMVKWFDQSYTEMRSLEETWGGWRIRYGRLIDYIIQVTGASLIVIGIEDIKNNLDGMSKLAVFFHVLFCTFPGLAGGILLLLPELFSVGKLSEKIKAISECSKCKKRLLDLNSPMGWKVYMDIYGNRVKSFDDHNMYTSYVRNNVIR